MQSQHHQLPESDTESDSLALDLVNLGQPPTRPTSPGPSAPARPVTPPHQIMPPPSEPPPTPSKCRGRHATLPDVATAPLQPPTPQYSLRLRQQQLAQDSVARPSGTTGSLNSMLRNMFQEAPQSFQEAMTSLDKDKWLKASEEEFEGFTERSIWKLVKRPKG